MESKLFSIGDVVALKTHPFYDGNTNVVISGDHLMLSPLMIVTEVYKSKQHFNGEKTNIFKYKCTWFSTKPYKFIITEVEENDLKIIIKCTSSINKNFLKRGDQVVFKTASLELGKKKSSLTFEDNYINGGVGNTLINSLLSFLPPVMLVANFDVHKSKHLLTDKQSVPIRGVPSIDVKLSFFDSTEDKVAGCTLPIEALQIIDSVSEDVINTLYKAIQSSGYVSIKASHIVTIAKPRHIAYRGGYYYLIAYDYLSNKLEETVVNQDTVYSRIKTPFVAEAPKFDIANKPEAATANFIINEISESISTALSVKAFIRIKYKNRNDQLSHRTLKNYEIILVKEGASEVSYLVGYCLLRHAKRNFRIDRIQSLQQLDIVFG